MYESARPQSTLGFVMPLPLPPKLCSARDFDVFWYEFENKIKILIILLEIENGE